jgi:iron complex outermembrane receptor protein
MKLHRLLLSLFALALADAASAQADSKSTAPSTDTVIKLEDFNVSDSRANGYRATQATSATGLAASVLDSPVPISILTGDFITDIGATRLADALMFVPGIQNSSYESTFSIQGYGGSQLFRNGFYRRQSYTLWNIDQVEVLKGAAAVFYGLLRPGGVINYITGKPTFKGNYTDVTTSVGTSELRKASVFSNYVVSPKLAIRVGLGLTEGGEYHTNAFNRQNYQGVSVAWLPTQNQSLTLDFEHIYWKFSDLRGTDLGLTNSKYIGNPAAIASGLNAPDWVAANLPAGSVVYDTIVPDRFNQKGRYFLNGSDTFSEQETGTIDLTYRAKLLPSLVYTADWNYAHDFFEEVRTIGNDQSIFADGSTVYRFGNFGNTRKSFNFNNKFTYRVDFAGTKNTITIGEDYLQVVQITPGLRGSEGNFFNGRTSIWYHDTPAQGAQRSGIQSFKESQTPDFYQQRRIYNDYYGYYIMNQQTLFNEKLMLLYGARANRITQHQRNFGDPAKGGVSQLWNSSNYAGPTFVGTNNGPNTQFSNGAGGVANQSKATDGAKTTPQLGALYKLTKELSLYASYTISTQPNGAVSADGKTGDYETDIGSAYGVKMALLDGRFSGNVNYYLTTQQELAYNDIPRQNATGLAPWYLYGLANESKGVEIDLDFMLTNAWSLKVAHSHDLGNGWTKTVAGGPPLGRPLGGVPKDQGSVWTRYDNRQQGWFVGGGFRFSKEATIGNDQIGFNYVVKRSGFVVFNAIGGYNFKAAGRSYSATLSINNLLDRKYREGTDAFWGAPRSVNLSVKTRL